MPGITVKFADLYKTYLSQHLISMLANARTSIATMLANLDVDKGLMDQPPLESPQAQAEPDDLYTFLAILRSKYNLDNAATSICGGAISLSWSEWPISSNHQPGCCGDCCVSYSMPGNPRLPANDGCSVSVTPTQTTTPTAPTSTIEVNQANYPTVNAANPPHKVFCYS